MNVQTVHTLMKVRGLNQSELARGVGISRQAVSLWFRGQDIDISIQSKHLLKLCETLETKVDRLLRPLPLISDKAMYEREAVKLLWDRLYPTLLDFVRALIIGQTRAIARLVEVYGLFDSSKIIGKKTWKRFPIYKKFIPPKRREELERIWKLQKDLKLT